MEHMPPLFYFTLGCMVGVGSVILLLQAWLMNDK